MINIPLLVIVALIICFSCLIYAIRKRSPPWVYRDYEPEEAEIRYCSNCNHILSRHHRRCSSCGVVIDPLRRASVITNFLIFISVFVLGFKYFNNDEELQKGAWRSKAHNFTDVVVVSESDVNMFLFATIFMFTLLFIIMIAIKNTVFFLLGHLPALHLKHYYAADKGVRKSAPRRK